MILLMHPSKSGRGHGIFCLFLAFHMLHLFGSIALGKERERQQIIQRRKSIFYLPNTAGIFTQSSGDLEGYCHSKTMLKAGTI